MDWMDFFNFRRMVTPLIIRIIFWGGIVGIIVIAVFIFFASLAGATRPNGTLAILGAFCGAPIFLVLSALLWRVFCESLIIVFSIHETLSEVRDILRRGSP